MASDGAQCEVAIPYVTLKKTRDGCLVIWVSDNIHTCPLPGDRGTPSDRSDIRTYLEWQLDLKTDCTVLLPGAKALTPGLLSVACPPTHHPASFSYSFLRTHAHEKFIRDSIVLKWIIC